MREISVLERKQLTNNVYVLYLEKPFDFIPGQLVSISICDVSPRIYSICSAPSDKFLAVLFDVKPEGKLTPLLARLKEGDKIYISDPFGDFICDSSPAYWIAAGTGIAPFYSMLKAGLGVNKILNHGGRTADSFYFRDEFVEIMGSNYTRCCSKEKGEGVYDGRLTQYLKELSDLPLNYKYYLCGSAEMVVDVRDILISKGIPYQSIFAEIYF